MGERTHSEWRCDSDDGLVDRVLCTLPRIYDESWSKEEYKHKNHLLIAGLLQSAKEFLSENGQGQIHLLLMEGQFYHWRVRSVLKSLGLRLAAWTRFDLAGLERAYKGYAPKDIWGNAINLDGWEMFLCCFMRKEAPDPVFVTQEKEKEEEECVGVEVTVQVDEDDGDGDSENDILFVE